MSFSSDIAKFVAKTKGNTDKAFRKIALDMGTSIIRRTPVDTGRARANWQVGIDRPPSGTIDREDKTGGIAISALHAGTKQTTTKNSIYIVNNLSYAPRLEYGYSVQAPQGMVRLTVAEFHQFVKHALRGLRT